MDRLLRRSPAPTKDAPSPTPTGERQLLTLEGVNTSVLHEAVRNSPGELIFCTVPHADLQVGILGEADGLKEVPDDRPYYGWKNAEVPVVEGLDYGFVVVDSGRHAEYDGRIRNLEGVMRTHLPDDKGSVSHYTNGRGVVIITGKDLDRTRKRIEKWDWILAVGNDAVISSALALAEKEMQDRQDYIGFQESHGLLLLSAIKDLGMEWRPKKGQNRQLDRFVDRLEGEVIDLGVVPVVAQKLGWDRMRDGSRHYWQLEEKRIARRLGAFDLSFDKVRGRVLSGLKDIAESSERKGQQEYNVELAGGNYQTYANTAIDNILTNYLGIKKESLQV